MDPQVKGPFGSTPIHIAAIRGDIDAIKLLMEVGVDINAQGEHGYTPLHEAVEQGQLEVAKLLLENGCNTSLVNGDGLTPLDLARALKEQKMIEIFEKK